MCISFHPLIQTNHHRMVTIQYFKLRIVNLHILVYQEIRRPSAASYLVHAGLELARGHNCHSVHFLS